MKIALIILIGFFSGIGEKLASDLNVPLPNIDNTDRFHEGTDLLSNLFTLEEIVNVIKRINIKKTSSVKDVKSMVLKDAFMAIPDKMLILFNSSIIHQIFPSAWKNATITPLPKKGDSTSVNNLRPISLLPLPGKLLERLICNRLQDFMGINNTLSDDQHGFRKGRSTLSAINKFLYDILNNVNNRYNTHGIFLDLRKAFDTISHNGLLNKLKSIGLSRRTRDWFRSYLTDRTQRVYANAILSDPQPVKYGVPQGSVLGPVLFIIYINDLANMIGDCKSSLYADDAVIYSTSHTTLSNTMPSISSWCRNSLLTINEAKTKWMSFIADRNIPIDDLTLSLNNKTIEKVNDFNYLGIILDRNLKFNLQRSKAIQQIRFRTYLLCKVRRYMDVRASLTVFKTMILPHFDYGDYIWFDSTVDDMYQFQLIQNKALRTVYEVKLGPNPLYNTEQLHVKAKCHKLRMRCDMHTLFFAFTLKSNPALIDTREIATRHHRGCRLIFQPIKHPVYGSSYIYRAIQYWNHLKAEYTIIDNIALFKTRIKRDFPTCFDIENFINYD